MANVEQHAVKQLLSCYESLATDHSKVALIFDEQRNQFMAVRVGWREQRRIHLCLVHIEITSDLVVIHCNNTEDQVASALVALGVAPDRIRLGFLPPEFQEFQAICANDSPVETA